MVATTVGILYFTDDNKVASARGLGAVGVLLLVWNVCVVALMLILVSLASKQKVKLWVQWGYTKAKAVLPLAR